MSVSCSFTQVSSWLWRSTALLSGYSLRNPRARFIRLSIQDCVYPSLTPVFVWWFWTFWAIPRQANWTWCSTLKRVSLAERGIPGYRNSDIVSILKEITFLRTINRLWKPSSDSFISCVPPAWRFLQNWFEFPPMWPHTSLWAGLSPGPQLT